MLRQRPALRIAGAVACLGLLASCSGTVGVDAPAVHGSDARACAALVKALPAHVADQKQRKVDAGGGYADAWGDPAIVLRCGVPRPKGFTKFAACQQANGVGWFVPQSQQTGKPETITMTTIGRAQNVEVTIPPDYWPPPATMVDLAPAIKRTIREVRPCV
ncbi:MAG: DUF3515 domain-containing protein [Nocardioidaceae bacterium]